MNPEMSIITPSLGASVIAAAIGGWLLGWNVCAWRHPDVRRMKALCGTGHDYRKVADDILAIEDAYR